MESNRRDQITIFTKYQLYEIGIGYAASCYFIIMYDNKILICLYQRFMLSIDVQCKCISIFLQTLQTNAIT